MALTRAFLIGGWRIEPKLNRIMKEDVTVQLEPRVMQLLCTLAAQPGEVFTRNDLLDEVWDGVTVGEEALTRAVSELRKAFRDDPKRPSVIETIYKTGYRLLAPVTPAEEAATTNGLPSISNFLRNKTASAALLACALFLGALIPLAYFAEGKSAPQKPFNFDFEFSTLTSLPGQELYPALSPDGETVVFSWRKPGSMYFSLMKKQVNSDELLALIEGEEAHYMNAAWSPAGDALALVRRNDNSCALLLYNVHSRQISTLTTCGAKSWPYLAWRPDGNALVYSDRADLDTPYRLYEVLFDDKSVRSITSPPRYFLGDRQVTYSQDGRSIAFVRINAAGMSDIHTISTSDKFEKQITFDSVKISGLSWVGSDNEITFTSNRSGEWDVWKVNAESREITPITLGANAYGMSYSASAGRIAFEKRTVDVDIWRVDLGANARDPKPYIVSSQWDDNAVFSKDGKKVAFASNRSGAPEIWVTDSEDAGERRLTNFNGGLVIQPRWSPDGKHIAFHARMNANADIYIANVETGVVERLTTDSAVDMSPEWSPEGAAIFFASNRSGNWQIWRKPVKEPQSPNMVTSAGGISPRVTPAGLYYLHNDKPGIWFLKKGGVEAQQIIESNSHLSFENWVIFGEDIFYLKPTENNLVGLFRYNHVTKEEQAVHSNLDLPIREIENVNMDLSHDGESLLFSKIVVLNSDLMLLEISDKDDGNPNLSESDKTIHSSNAS